MDRSSHVEVPCQTKDMSAVAVIELAACMAKEMLEKGTFALAKAFFGEVTFDIPLKPEHANLPDGDVKDNSIFARNAGVLGNALKQLLLENFNSIRTTPGPIHGSHMDNSREDTQPRSPRSIEPEPESENDPFVDIPRLQNLSISAESSAAVAARKQKSQTTEDVMKHAVLSILQVVKQAMDLRVSKLKQSWLQEQIDMMSFRAEEEEHKERELKNKLARATVAMDEALKLSRTAGLSG